MTKRGRPNQRFDLAKEIGMVQLQTAAWPSDTAGTAATIAPSCQLVGVEQRQRRGVDDQIA
jgi:hypothetical protein